MGTKETPRVWVGCLGCYNGGALVGEWFDATDAPQEMADFDQAISGPAGPKLNHIAEGHVHEELWVFDREGFGSFLKGECSPSEAAGLAAFIESIPDYFPVAAVGAWLDNEGRTVDAGDSFADCEDDFAEAYQGDHATDADFAQELAEELDLVNDSVSWPYTCIDWDDAASELMNDYWSDGQYHFRNC
jgi:antirestriction protein